MALTAEGTTKFADAKGVKLHYHEAGAGPVLIVVPSPGTGASAWGQFKYNIDGLSRHFRVILLNLPPAGQSDKTITYDGPRHAFYAKVLLDFMDSLGIEKAHFIGGSPGALPVMKFAIDHPERADKLVLQCPPMGRPSMFTPWPWEGSRLSQVVRQDPSRENVLRQMESMIPREDLRTEEFTNDRFAGVNDQETNEASRRITGPSEDLSPDLGKITHPCLIVWGLNDRDVPLDHGLRLAQLLPNARFHVYGNGIGHFPNYERPREYDRLVIDFLSN